MNLMRYCWLLAMAVAVPCVGYGDQLDNAIRKEMDRQHIPGLTLAVVRHGKIERLGAYGYGDLEWHAKATNGTRFEIASISKMFTGAAARILMEEGKLDPEDPVGKYLDGIPETWKPLKLRHLLTMSTGLDEDWGSDLIPYRADVIQPDNDADTLKSFYGMKPVAPIGSEFHYSSPGYAMLGMIVAKVSGKPLVNFIDDRIFKPAGMTESSFIDNWAVVPERAQGYRMQKDQLLKGWYLGQYLHARADVGVLSTARDLGRWVIALEQGKIVKNPNKLWEGSTADSGRPLDYAYGWGMSTLLGHRRLSHAGGYRTGFHTLIVKYPDDDVSVVVLTNCDFSAIRDFVLMATRKYLPGLPDPLAEGPRPDSDPAETATMIAALRAVGAGKIDEAVMTSDALEPQPLSELGGYLKAVESFAYAGRAKLPGTGIVMHGHRLVDYETIKTKAGSDVVCLTLYRDDRGKIAYVEETT
ncbi:MAG: hypothetical protein QOJ65_2504 [Fimbriimonadaceae bacterium]|jgi:CubicO group peptidase (beta-lactamase class C family)|nr:hypothetical protein [Fimbriimonadaceae bacterium]